MKKKLAMLLVFIAVTVIGHSVYMSLDGGPDNVTSPEPEIPVEEPVEEDVEEHQEEYAEEVLPEDGVDEHANNLEPFVHTAGIALVAHAGGAIGGYEGSNSLEAIQSANARNFRYIEIDMIVTRDSRTVMNHGWNSVADRIPGIRNGIMTHEEFMSHRIFNQFTPVDMGMLIEFLRQNPEPRIITDTKDATYVVLYSIANYFPELLHRFIPQVYSFGDAQHMRELGFTDIILTVYEMSQADQDPERIHNYALENNLYAVTIPDELAAAFLAAYPERTNEMRYMVHTVNSVGRANELQAMGVYALYTGFLTYSADLTEITYIPYPVRDYISRITENVRRLSAGQQSIVNSALFYKINIPAYVHYGAVEPVWADYLVAAPFISPITNQAYFVDRHFANYNRGREFNSQDSTLSITGEGGQRFIIYGASYGLFIYRGIIFISEAVVEGVFGFEVLHNGDYLVLVRRGSGYSSEELFQIAELLFAGIR